MITIDTYTGQWQGALSPRKPSPRAGSHVRVAVEPDAREWSDFRQCLEQDGKRLEFVRFLPRLKMDLNMVVNNKQEAV